MRSSTGSVLPTHKSFDMPDEVREFEKGSLEIVNIGEQTVARATFQPGWHWAEHVKPIAQTHLCEVKHFGYILSGRMKVRMNDGSEAEYQTGEIMAVEPHHDAWVVGKEPCVLIDWAGASTYAKE